MDSYSLTSSFPVMDLRNGFCLREPRESDAQRYWECYNDPLVSRFIPDDCIPETVVDALKELRYLSDSFFNRTGVTWIIADNLTNSMVGHIGLFDWDKYHNRIEISYELNSSLWRRGITGLAVSAVLDFAFNKMRVNRVQATTVTYNYPSMKLLQKNGFSQEGILSKYKYYRGEFVDIVMFGYSQSQYLSNMKVLRRSENVARDGRITDEIMKDLFEKRIDRNIYNGNFGRTNYAK